MHTATAILGFLKLMTVDATPVPDMVFTVSEVYGAETVQVEPASDVETDMGADACEQW